jgi:hypothetical protein
MRHPPRKNQLHRFRPWSLRHPAGKRESQNPHPSNRRVRHPPRKNQLHRFPPPSRRELRKRKTHPCLKQTRKDGAPAPPVRRKRESKPAPLESKGAAPPKKESAAQIPATLPKRIKKRKDRPLLETNPQGWGTRAERRGEAWVVTSRFGLWRGWGEVRILVRRLLT